MPHHHLFLAAARCWERAGHFDRAAERYARADAWAEAGRCWAQAERPVDAANAYARAGEPIGEARQWLASPWPERARRPYRQALEMGLSTAAEVEALLGLGEIELASERAFGVGSENGCPVEALRLLARLAAARGRPDLAARVWGQVITESRAAREVFDDWERVAPWNRSLGWRRPQAGTPEWPSRAFRDVQLELVWEEMFGAMNYGNRALAWSANGGRFAATVDNGDLVLANFTNGAIQDHTLPGIGAVSVAFIPESDSVLVGCRDGRVIRVDAAGAYEDIEALRMPGIVYGITFSNRRLAIASQSSSDGGALLKIWPHGFEAPGALNGEEQLVSTRDRYTNPFCAWSPDGQTLAWCPGSWSEGGGVSDDLYLITDAGKRCVSAAHDNGIRSIAFSPDSYYLITVSFDRTLALRNARTGETAAPSWNCVQMPLTAVFHPYAALIAAGGTEDLYGGFQRLSRLYLFRFLQAAPPSLKVIQENATETAVNSLAFSPDGEHLVMGTDDRLSLFRVHLLEVID